MHVSISPAASKSVSKYILSL